MKNLKFKIQQESEIFVVNEIIFMLISFFMHENYFQKYSCIH